MIFTKFSDVYCVRFDSVQNIIQNDSVSPCLACLQASRGRRVPRVTFQGPLLYGALWMLATALCLPSDGVPSTPWRHQWEGWRALQILWNLTSSLKRGRPGFLLVVEPCWPGTGPRAGQCSVEGLWCKADRVPGTMSPRFARWLQNYLVMEHGRRMVDEGMWKEWIKVSRSL